MARELQEHDWNTLVLSIIQGDCILMLGPDAITEQVDGASVPLMQLFAQHLRNKLPAEMPLPEQYSLTQVAQTFKNYFGAYDLRVATEEFFQHRRTLQNQSLEDLAALPFKLVVNTIPGTQLPVFSANTPPGHARERARKSSPEAELRADEGVRSA